MLTGSLRLEDVRGCYIRDCSKFSKRRLLSSRSVCFLLLVVGYATASANPAVRLEVHTTSHRASCRPRPCGLATIDLLQEENATVQFGTTDIAHVYRAGPSTIGVNHTLKVCVVAAFCSS